MDRLKGRVAIVTGSGQGMGLAIASCCAKEGAKIVITDINDETIAKAVEEIKTYGVEALGVRMDVTSKEQIKAMAETAVKTWGRIDILVNNAGGSLNTPYKLGRNRRETLGPCRQCQPEGCFSLLPADHSAND